MRMDLALRRLTQLGMHLESAAMATNGIQASQTAAFSSSARSGASDDLAPGVYIVGAKRTPMGAFQGALSSLKAPELGSVAIRGALEQARVSPDQVSEVVMGNVCSAGVGQAPARQASLGASLPVSVDCTTVNKVCSSGMKAVTMGAQSILCGTADVVVAGGMESMSNVPYYAPTLRGGARLGHSTLVDGVITDGLWDARHDVHMGECGERCAETMGFDRAAQDAHATSSHARATAAEAAGLSAWERVPVPVPQRRGEPVLVEGDESLAKMDASRLPSLRPAFRKQGGTITAGNASPLTDGAAALVLASAEAVRRLGLRPLGRVLGWADAAQEPMDFPTTPAKALPLALERAELSVRDVDYWEVNEAFSVVHLANQRLLDVSADRINVHGGAVALGHPIGASGARVLVTLLNVLRAKGGRIGAAGICNGGGGATAVVLEYLGDRP